MRNLPSAWAPWQLHLSRPVGIHFPPTRSYWGGSHAFVNSHAARLLIRLTWFHRISQLSCAAPIFRALEILRVLQIPEQLQITFPLIRSHSHFTSSLSWSVLFSAVIPTNGTDNTKWKPTPTWNLNLFSSWESYLLIYSCFCCLLPVARARVKRRLFIIRLAVHQVSFSYKHFYNASLSNFSFAYVFHSNAILLLGLWQDPFSTHTWCSLISHD